MSFVFILGIAGAAKSQEEKDKAVNRYFISAFFGLRGAGLQGEVQFSSRWLTYARYSGYNLKPGSLPSNYDPGYTNIVGFQFTENPTEPLNAVSVGAGRVLTRPGQKGWVAVKTGLAIANATTLKFYPAGTVNEINLILIGGRDASHTHTETKHSGIGGHFAIEGNLNVSRIFGFGFGVETIVFGPRSTVQPYLSLNLGHMKPRKKAS